MTAPIAGTRYALATDVRAWIADDPDPETSAELEALLLTHPEIADAAVVAALDEEAGEIPKAFVVLKDGSQLDAEAVMQFIASQVAPHKKVRAVSFIDAVPKSSAGKILRKDLKGK